MTTFTLSADFAESVLSEASLGEPQLQIDTVYRAADSPWAVPAYRFDVLIRGQKAGTISFRVSSDDRLLQFAGHIGFGISEPFRGRRLAGRAVQMLLPLAAKHGVKPLWLLCNPDNLASMQVMDWLGATYIETVDIPPDYTRYYARGERQKRRYRLDY